MRNNLKSCRLAANLTQKEIAEKLNVTERQYQRIENGEQDGTIKLWLRIKAFFGGTIDTLIENS